MKCNACRAFYHVFATGSINFMIQKKNVRICLSYDIKINLKLDCVVMCATVKRHYITLLNK